MTPPIGSYKTTYIMTMPSDLRVLKTKRSEVLKHEDPYARSLTYT